MIWTNLPKHAVQTISTVAPITSSIQETAWARTQTNLLHSIACFLFCLKIDCLAKLSHAVICMCLSLYLFLFQIENTSEWRRFKVLVLASCAYFLWGSLGISSSNFLWCPSHYRVFNFEKHEASLLNAKEYFMEHFSYSYVLVLWNSGMFSTLFPVVVVFFFAKQKRCMYSHKVHPSTLE